MAKSLRRTDKELAELYGRYIKTVYCVCFAYMKNTSDAEDMVQDTFVKLIKENRAFESAEHEKAWLICTAMNLCKNNLKHWWRKREALEAWENLPAEPPLVADETLETVMNLPGKYKTVVFMYYYEGYTSVEIAQALSKPQATVRGYLYEAREILRKKLGEEFNYERQTN
ncbi:MAG: RNA polymerase sigma factor [Clostridiales bacterium]|nr:RNA polymerase sigma factor [Clostridiales bacterium]